MRSQLPCRHKTALFCLSACAAACTGAQIEYDRMTGTAFPAPQVIGADTFSISSIYSKGEILLQVDEDDTAIAPLTGPHSPIDPDQYDYITAAEIETLEFSNRDKPAGPIAWACSFLGSNGTCTRYHLYGIVVDHWEEHDDGTRKQSAMGWMFNSGDRSAFVQYYKNTTNSSDNGKYLRSAVHEVGHAFNLSHCDGDGSTTIMNRTGTVGSGYTYAFSAASLDHLQNHAKTAVWPGIGQRDYGCPHVH